MIVVGIDYSEDSRHALRWAAAQGPVHAVHAGPPVFDVVAHTPTAEHRRAALLPDLTAFVEDTVGNGVTCEIVDGPPSDGLVRAATGADLLVVGRHGHGAIARLLMGSTSHDVVRHAACPVAVVPLTARSPVRRVVVGVDGSDAATAALHWAADQARQRNVPLRLVHAEAPPVLTASLSLSIPSTEPARAFLDDVVAKTVAETGGAVTVESALSMLAPAPALLTAASPDDLLVVGSRGLGGFARAVLGSTSSVVVEQSAGAVVVVPWHH